MAIYNVGRDIDNRELGIGHRASGIGHRASGIGHRASGIGNCELEVETRKQQGQASSDAQRTMIQLITND